MIFTKKESPHRHSEYWNCKNFRSIRYLTLHYFSSCFANKQINGGKNITSFGGGKNIRIYLVEFCWPFVWLYAFLSAVVFLSFISLLFLHNGNCLLVQDWFCLILGDRWAFVEVLALLGVIPFDKGVSELTKHLFSLIFSFTWLIKQNGQYSRRNLPI